MFRKLLLPAGVVLLAVSCGAPDDGPWFDGDVPEALAEAAVSDRLVMVGFTTSWCVWCRRLETDTLADPAVRESLRAFVPVKVDAEREGAELARKLRVDSYPTLVFLDTQGNEVDRILGYLPPDRFRTELERVRAGNTFVAGLKKLSVKPGDVEAMRRTVEGLLDRSDIEGAIARLECFRPEQTEARELCDQLMFRARAELQTLVYDRTGKLYRENWPRIPAAPDLPSLEGLRQVVAGLGGMSRSQQGLALREARLEDARRLLGEADLDRLGTDALLEAGRFAMANGLYEAAASVYTRWYDEAAASASVDELNQVAWDLYLTGRSPELAIAVARQAVSRSEDPDIVDTLARLLYVNGQQQQALELAAHAVGEARSVGDRRLFVEVKKRIASGAPLEDRPPFDLWPGLPDEVL